MTFLKFSKISRKYLEIKTKFSKSWQNKKTKTGDPRCDFLFGKEIMIAEKSQEKALTIALTSEADVWISPTYYSLAIASVL